MKTSKFLKLEVCIEGEILRNVNTELTINEYFFIDTEMVHNIDTEIIPLIKQAIKKLHEFKMITVNLVWGNLDYHNITMIKSYRLINRYDGLKISKAVNNTFNFDHPETVKLTELFAKVTELQIYANGLYIDELLKLKNENN